MSKDVLGKALFDYYKRRFKKPLLLHNDYGDPEHMPVNVFFQNHKTMSDLDLFALSISTGRILDIGAGAGRHSLELQKLCDVTAMDYSPFNVKTMKARGVQQIIQADIFEHQSQKFDTLLLLMNGIGLAGTLDNLDQLLQKFKEILNPEGKVIFDSSDISYLYRDNLYPQDRYFGEIAYCYEYKKEKGDWFKWLYIDKNTMVKKAEQAGFDCQIIYQGQSDQYLARLTMNET
ncbi:MAG: class I SAM-dependent methyltransferase [Candidatus Cyclobacteriaceae bacterium M3_2C_046]